MNNLLCFIHSLFKRWCGWAGWPSGGRRGRWGQSWCRVASHNPCRRDCDRRGPGRRWPPCRCRRGSRACRRDCRSARQSAGATAWRRTTRCWRKPWRSRRKESLLGLRLCPARCPRWSRGRRDRWCRKLRNWRRPSCNPKTRSARTGTCCPRGGSPCKWRGCRSRTCKRSWAECLCPESESCLRTVSQCRFRSWRRCEPRSLAWQPPHSPEVLWRRTRAPCPSTESRCKCGSGAGCAWWWRPSVRPRVLPPCRAHAPGSSHGRGCLREVRGVREYRSRDCSSWRLWSGWSARRPRGSLSWPWRRPPCDRSPRTRAPRPSPESWCRCLSWPSAPWSCTLKQNTKHQPTVNSNQDSTFSVDYSE